MADTEQASYLSIGEVLGLLLEDFPDVTISKIRFLESQGLISPERTASGYRKFYDTDVDLLRVILTEQRSNYLPLRVIKDRLESGEIDPTGEQRRPDDETDDHDGDEHGDDVPAASVDAHPASGRATGNGATPDGASPAGEAGSEADGGPEPSADQDDAAPPADRPTEPEDRPGSATLMPGVLLDRAELCAMAGMTDGELDQLENFGVVTSREGSVPPLYGDDAVEIARPACELLRSGVDARHLRTWRTAAEREASLFEQLVTPRIRQRNPESRAQALTQLRRLDELGGSLRAALTRHALRRFFES